jgi:catechol 2,3-dioxygenase-like lactoylglutathione lyase family enzyme
MPKTAFSHVAIGVTDMDRALAFYQGVLGLETAYDEVEDVVQEGVKPYRRHAVFLSWPGEEHGSFLALDTQDRSGEVKPIGFNDYGVHHFSLWVDDLDGIHDRAVKAGCEVMLTPRLLDPNLALKRYGGGTPVKTTFLRDPDGNVIQLDQAIEGE